MQFVKRAQPFDDSGVSARWARSRTWTSARCTPSTMPSLAPRASLYTTRSRARHARRPPAGSCSPCQAPLLAVAFCSGAPPLGLVPVRPGLHHRPSACARQVRRTISRFKDRAYSGSFRADGKLLVAGSEDAVVQARAFPTLNPCSSPCAAAAHAPGRRPPCCVGGWQGGDVTSGLLAQVR